MRKWEKMLLVFFLAIILIVFLWSVMMVGRSNGSGLKQQLKEKRATESMSIGRVSKED